MWLFRLQCHSYYNAACQCHSLPQKNSCNKIFLIVVVVLDASFFVAGHIDRLVECSVLANGYNWPRWNPPRPPRNPPPPLPRKLIYVVCSQIQRHLQNYQKDPTVLKKLQAYTSNGLYCDVPVDIISTVTCWKMLTAFRDRRWRSSATLLFQITLTSLRTVIKIW